MSRTDELEEQESERRWAQTVKLQPWETELRGLAEMLDDEDLHGWPVRYV